MDDAHADQEKKDVSVSLVMPDSERRAIEDWMQANRMFSRGAAIRSLVRFALANGAKPDDEPDLRRKS